MTEYFYWAFHRQRFVALGVLAAVFVAATAVVSTLRIHSDWTRLYPYPDDAEVVRAMSESGNAVGIPILLAAMSGGLPDPRAVRGFKEDLQEIGLFSHIQGGLEEEQQTPSLEGLGLFLDVDSTRELVRRLDPARMRSSVGEQVALLFSPAPDWARHFLKHDPLQVSALVMKNVSLAAGYELRDGLIVSTDGDHTLLLAFPPRFPDANWLAHAAAAIPHVKDKARSLGMKCRMPSSLLLRAEVLESVKRGLSRATTISLALVVLLLLWFHRRDPWMVVCIVLPQALALVLTFALYRLVEEHIDLITALAAAVLTGLGVDFGIHLAAAARAATGTQIERIRSALTEVGPGIGMGAATTAAAFLAILVTGMRSLYPLGCVAAAGILISWACYIFAFPVLFWVGPTSAPATLRAWKPPRFLTRSALPLLLATVLLFPLAAFRWRFVSDFRLFVPGDSLIYRDMTERAAPGGAFGSDLLFIQAASNGLERDLALHANLAALFPDAQWHSPFGLVPDAGRWSVRRAIFEEYARRRSPEECERELKVVNNEYDLVFPSELNDYFQTLFRSFSEAESLAFLQRLPVARAYYSEDGRRFSLMATRKDGAHWTDRDFAALRDADADRAVLRVTSTETMLDAIRARALPQSARAGVVALLAVLIGLRLFFQRWLFVALTLVPLVLGMLMTWTFLGLFGWSLNFFNLAVMPLIFGLGIDDGVHFMQAFTRTENAQAALSRTLRPIVLTTLTTCVGFGVLMSISFQGVSSMGLVVVVGMISCLLATVCVLPALAARSKPVFDG